MKITKTGTVAVITTDITAEQFHKVAKFKPEALVLTDEETKEAKFVVRCGANNGEIGKYGVNLAKGVDGKLCIAVNISGLDDEAATKWLKDAFIAPITSLQKVQEQILAALPEIEEAEAKFATLFEETPTAPCAESAAAYTAISCESD